MKFNITPLCHTDSIVIDILAYSFGYLSLRQSDSCHYCHSLRTCNFLIHNVFMKNVKSDSKSKINFCCK